MSYMRVQKVKNFLIWHEITKIIKKPTQKIKKKQHATGKEDTKSKTSIFLQIPIFFTLFKNPGLKSPFLPFFTKKRMFFGKKVKAYS